MTQSLCSKTLPTHCPEAAETSLPPAQGLGNGVDARLRLIKVNPQAAMAGPGDLFWQHFLKAGDTSPVAQWFHSASLQDPVFPTPSCTSGGLIVLPRLLRRPAHLPTGRQGSIPFWESPRDDMDNPNRLNITVKYALGHDMQTCQFGTKRGARGLAAWFGARGSWSSKPS